MLRTKGARLLWGLALLMVVALLALAAACNGNGGGDGDTPEAGETVEADAGDDGDGDGGDGGDDGDASDSALEDFFGQWANTQGRVTYEYTSEGGGSSDSGTFTLYWMPPTWRWESADDGDETTIISTADDYITCDSSSCQSLGGLGELPPPVPFFGLFTDPNALQTTFAGALGADLDTSEETIAGVTARCFSASAEAGGDAAGSEWCWSDENGLLLRVRVASTTDGQESSYEFEATEIGDVSASDFDPPYPVQDLGDLLPDGIEIPTQ